MAATKTISIAERLHQARNTRAAAIGRLQELEHERGEARDIDGIAKNTVELDEQRRLIANLAHLIAGFERDADLEEAAARSRQYGAQVDKVEQLLPARAAAARALESDRRGDQRGSTVYKNN
jgi:hypothetical protein